MLSMLFIKLSHQAAAMLADVEEVPIARETISLSIMRRETQIYFLNLMFFFIILTVNMVM
jgi:hypothetical protein